MDMNEGTLAGNTEIMDYLLGELRIDREKAADDWLSPISRGRLAVARIRSL